MHVLPDVRATVGEMMLEGVFLWLSACAANIQTGDNAYALTKGSKSQ